MAILFDCGWEDGSGILNTGGASVWDSSTDPGARLSVVSSPTLWGGSALRLGTVMSANAYLTEAVAAGTYGVRLGVYIDSSSLSGGNTQDLLWGVDGSSISLFFVSILHDGSGHNLTVRVMDSASTLRVLGYVPVSLDTRYQLLLRIQKNVSAGASFKVLDGAGDLVGTEKTLGAYTTRNSSLASMNLGNGANSGYTITLLLDAVQVTDTYAYPSPAADEVSASYTMPAVATQPDTTVPTLSGVRKGIPTLPGVSATPVVATPLLFTYPAGQLLICDWEAGTDEKNTGGAGTWDAINDVGNSLQLAFSSAIWGSYLLGMTAPVARADVTKTIGATDELGIRVHILNHGGFPGAGAIQPLFTLLDGSSNTLLKISAVYLDPDTSFVVTAFDTGGIERTVSEIMAFDTCQILIKWKKGTAGGASVRFMHKNGSTVLSEGALSTAYTTRNTDATLMSLGSLAGTGFPYAADFDEFQAISSYEYPEPSSLTPSRTIYTPSVTVAPAVAVPAMFSVRYGTFTMAGTTVTPIVAVPVMTSDINGGYAMPGITVPAWPAVPTLTGVLILMGVYAMPSLIVHPVVVTAAIHGIRYFRLWLRKVE